MTRDDLCYLSATEALRLFRSHDLSPIDLLEALVCRAERVEPIINAFTSQRIQAARQAALEAEENYCKGASHIRPLEGLPVVLKNEHLLVGDRTTMGSALLRGTVDRENSPVTQRLLDAGAVIHAKSNVPEFFCVAFTSSSEHGVTRNPWNPTITCGGSSGGSAAALAAGLTMLATGSDMGGSIRIPASLCGIVGLKPSYGRVPEGVYRDAMFTYNHQGPMARSVADCTLMFNVLNGAHPADPATVTPNEQFSAEPNSLAGLAVAVSMDLGFASVDSDIVQNTRAIAVALAGLGAHVEDVRIGWDERVPNAAAKGMLFFAGRALATATAGSRALLNDYTLKFMENALTVTPEEYLWHFEVMGAMDRALHRVLDRFDVLLCPTMAIAGFPAEGPAEPAHEFSRASMTYPFNMLSRHPVLSVPSGFAANGVPTGVQIVGRRFAERDVIRVGAALEGSNAWDRSRRPI